MRAAFQLVLVFGLGVPIGSEALTLIGQRREVLADVGFFGGDFEEAPDFSPFDETVEAAIRSPETAAATASQASTIAEPGAGTLVVEGVGSGSGDAEMGSPPPFGAARARGDSLLELTFSVEAPTPYELLAAIAGAVTPDVALGTASAMASVELLESGGALVTGSSASAASGLPPSEQTFEQTERFAGVLAPGTYVLRARALAGGSHEFFPSPTVSGEARFEVQFRLVPEPGTALLLGSGLLALVFGRKASRRRSRRR